MSEDVRRAVQERLSAAADNLYRANLAGLTHDYGKLWGESGETLQQIINGYRAEVERWERALSSVSGN